MTHRNDDPMIVNPCPICHAAPYEGCLRDDGTRAPLGVGHVGRATGGEPLHVQHTGDFTPEGEAILEEATDAPQVCDFAELPQGRRALYRVSSFIRRNLHFVPLLGRTSFAILIVNLTVPTWDLRIFAYMVLASGVYAGRAWPRQFVGVGDDGPRVRLSFRLATWLSGNEWLPLVRGPAPDGLDWTAPLGCPCGGTPHLGHRGNCERGRAIAWLRAKLSDAKEGLEP